MDETRSPTGEVRFHHSGLYLPQVRNLRAPFQVLSGSLPPGEAVFEDRAGFAVDGRRGRLADSFAIPRSLRLAATRGMDVKERTSGLWPVGAWGITSCSG